MSDYAGIRMYRVLFSPNIVIEQGAQLRVLISGVPCELSDNFLTLEVIDNRGNPNLDFAGNPTLAYVGSSHPIPVQLCNVPYTPQQPSVWLRFEEPSGTLYDSSGLRNHAATYSGITYRHQCRIDNCIRFNIQDQSYIEIPPSNSLQFSNPVTIEMFMYPEKEGDWQGLISKGTASDAFDYHVALTPRNTIGFYTDKGGIWYEGSVPIPLNRWTHIAVTIGDCTNSGGSQSSCQLRMFINGFEDRVSPSPGSSQNAPPASDIDLGPDLGELPITIGSWAGNVPKLYPFTGLIDNVVLYKTELTPNEIRTIYTRYP